VHKARIFTKPDLHGAYILIQINEIDGYKTAFGTHYSELEYRVMPFGL